VRTVNSCSLELLAVTPALDPGGPVDPSTSFAAAAAVHGVAEGVARAGAPVPWLPLPARPSVASRLRRGEALGGRGAGELRSAAAQAGPCVSVGVARADEVLQLFPAKLRTTAPAPPLACLAPRVVGEAGAEVAAAAAVPLLWPRAVTG
jgi:hypothetical protein